MDTRGGRTGDALLWGLCWSVLVAAVVVDAAVPQVALSGSYGLAAVLAGALLTVRRAVITAAAALAAAALSFLWNHNLGSLAWGLRLVVAAALSATAVAIAVSRERRERRLARMTAIAETAQRAVLRTLPEAVHEVGFAARYVSAAEEARIGGDLYEVVSSPFGTRAIVGDVKGKGLDAVQLAATVLGTFRRAAATAIDLVEVAGQLDEVVASVAGLEDFVTAVLVEFGSDGSLAVVNIAHMPPVIIHSGCAGLAEVLDTGDPVPPLGMHPEPVVVRATWEPGARLLLYTDGTSESRDSQGRFFEVLPNAGLLSQGTLEQALDQFVSALTHHVGHRLDDDVALVLAERRTVDSSSISSPHGCSVPRFETG